MTNTGHIYKRWCIIQIKAWLPACLWCVFIFWGSTDDGGGQATSLRLMTFLHINFPALSWEQLAKLIFYLRKACHVTEYAILAGLVMRGFLCSSIIKKQESWSFPLAILTFSLCVGYAASDEYHQSLTQERCGCVTDVMVDAVGVFLGLQTMWCLIYFKTAKLDSTALKIPEKD